MSAPRFPMTLQPQENVLDGLTCYEKVDVQAMNDLLRTDLLDGKPRSEFEQLRHQSNLHHLAAYKTIVDESGMAKVTYKRSKGNTFGRCNPVHGLGGFNLHRRIRHTIFKGTYRDFDIKNAHPVILYQVMYENGIPVNHLKSYIDNRQEWLDYVCATYSLPTEIAKEAAKNLFIIYCYGGGFKGWLENWGLPDSCVETERLADYRKEVRYFQKILCRENSAMAKIAKEIKERDSVTDFNLDGTVASYYLQEWEVRILEKLYKYSLDRGYIQEGSVVLCADGLMLAEGVSSSILAEFEQLVRSEIGFELIFTEKELDEFYTPEEIQAHFVRTQQEVSKFVEELPATATYDGYLFSEVAQTDTSLANFFCVVFPNRFLLCNERLYEYNGVYWETVTDKVSSAIHNVFDRQFVDVVKGLYWPEYEALKKKIIDADPLTDEQNESNKKITAQMMALQKLFGTTMKNLGTFTKKRNIISQILVQITDNRVEFDKNPFLFAFTNKVYNLKENDWVTPHYSQYISMTTKYAYDEAYPSSRKDKLNSILTSILPTKETRDHLLVCLSTGLWGQNLEHFFILTGPGGNGKTFVTNQTKKCLGDYADGGPVGVLQMPIKASGPCPELANLEKKRFVLFSEPPKNRTLCASTVKDLTGGAEEVQGARAMYESKTSKSMPMSSFMDCNVPPKMDEVNDAVVRRMVVYPFDVKFVAPDKYEAADEDERKEMCIANPEYKTQEFRNDHRQAMFEILAEHWKTFQAAGYVIPPLPAECQKKTNVYLAASDDILPWFYDNYEEGDKDKDFVYIADMYEEIKKSEMYTTGLTIEQKREFSKTRFPGKIAANTVLRRVYRDRDSYFNGERMKKPYIVGYKRKFDEANEEEESEHQEGEVKTAETNGSSDWYREMTKDH